MAKSSRSRTSKARRRTTRKASMVFTRRNYMLLLAGLVMLVVGYAIMRIENEVEGFISLYIAPLIILGGYIEIIYAILWRPRDEQPDAEQAAG